MPLVTILFAECFMLIFINIKMSKYSDSVYTKKEDCNSKYQLTKFTQLIAVQFYSFQQLFLIKVLI